MTKSELIQRLAERNPHLYQRDVERIVTAIFDEITAAQIRNGCDFAASAFRSQAAAKYVKAVTRTGDLIAIGEAVLPNVYHPTVVL